MTESVGRTDETGLVNLNNAREVSRPQSPMESTPLCDPNSEKGEQDPLAAVGAHHLKGFSWKISTVGLGLLLLLTSVLVAHLTGVQRIDLGESVIVPVFGDVERATITTTTTTLDPRTEKLVSVCCHHVIAFGVTPKLTWGTATLEEQASWSKWKCDSVIKRRFGTVDDVAENCRSLGVLTYTFYMYRVTGDTDWPIENVNVASLGGVLWYLHNEVIVARPRKFGIKIMRRFKVQVAGTRALEKMNMTFGVRFAYDTQACTGAGPWASEDECASQFGKYGHFVGCNNLGSYPFPTAAKGFPCHYPEAVWYSLPRGGRCHGQPTGEPNCTYSFEESGSIPIDELVGIEDYDELPDSWMEYDVNTDTGHGFSWWDHVFDNAACRQRWQQVKDMWARKFPGMETDDDLPRPSCDFRCSFYPHPPLECKMPQPIGAEVCSTHAACVRVMQTYHAPHVGHYLVARKLNWTGSNLSALINDSAAKAERP